VKILFNKLSLHIQPDENIEDSIMNEFYLKLQKYCYFLAQNKWDGDDLAHEAMVKALVYYHQDMITSALLKKIAYNHWMDLLRKSKKEEIKQDNYCGEAPLPSIDILSTVDFLIDHLTPQQAIIFFLKEAFQYKSKEIADILTTTEISVKSSLYRAKKRLEKPIEHNHMLESFWEEDQREKLCDLLYNSLLNNDPTYLIDAIHSILSISNDPKAVPRKTIPFQASAPISTLCVAA
jgi:DNA-directed RNA polymerase specialized sigma24 family protein